MKKLLIVFLLFVVLTGCTQTQETDGLNVIVSIAPYGTFVEEIGSERVNVEVMVPKGGNPHTYEPSPQKLTSVSNADVYVKVGTPIEFEVAWFDKIRSVNNEMLVVDSSSGISANDPHIWVSPRMTKTIAKNIYEGLAEADPANKEYYEGNMNDYLEELDSLDEEIQNSVSKMENKNFIVYHGAWENLANDYNLTQIAIEEGGKNPSAKQIQETIKLARRNNITVVFASPQFSTRSAEVIADEINGSVVLIDPLAQDYITNMKKVAEAFGKS